jgi:hypothetical protein
MVGVGRYLVVVALLAPSALDYPGRGLVERFSGGPGSSGRA